MILLPSAYLAPVSYYAILLARGREVRIEQWEHYIKQTIRNRAYIATESGRMALTVPVEHNGGQKLAMRDVKISDHGNWRHLHWQALKAAYEKSPFFDFFCDEIAVFYEWKTFRYLLDFNTQLQQAVCGLIGIPYEPVFSEEYQSEGAFLDLRDGFCSPRWEGNTPYYQVFSHRHGFLPDLSIVDLLFNMGPESLLVLNKYKPFSS